MSTLNFLVVHPDRHHVFLLGEAIAGSPDCHVQYILGLYKTPLLSPFFKIKILLFKKKREIIIKIKISS